jgi:hypothetical protein
MYTASLAPYDVNAVAAAAANTGNADAAASANAGKDEGKDDAAASKRGGNKQVGSITFIKLFHSLTHNIKGSITCSRFC